MQQKEEIMNEIWQKMLLQSKNRIEEKTSSAKNYDRNDKGNTKLVAFVFSVSAIF